MTQVLPHSDPRVVATDLDGTFLRTDGTLSERSALAWAALDGIGVRGIVVTARPPRWVNQLSALVAPGSRVICGNGAFHYDPHARRVVEEHGFEPEGLVEIVRDLRASVPGVTFAVERSDGMRAEHAYDDPHPKDAGAVEDVGTVPTARVARIEEVQDRPIGKMLALASGLADDAFLEAVAEVLGERAVLAYSGAFGLAEINPPGVTKAAALAQVCAGWGVAASEVWAFGDMPNDLPMLRWAGASFAVANAHPDVASAATHGCASNDEDGVAGVLEALLARRR